MSDKNKDIAGYAYWISALVAQSGHPVRTELLVEQRRSFRELARLLIKNEFDDLTQLEDAPDPSGWEGVLCL